MTLVVPFYDVIDLLGLDDWQQPRAKQEDAASTKCSQPASQQHPKGTSERGSERRSSSKYSIKAS